MKFTKIFSMTVLLSILLSGNVFAKELTSGSLSVHYNVLEGALKIYNKAVFKGNGTPEGDAFAKKCNDLEQKRVDKYVENEKHFLKQRPNDPKQIAQGRKLLQEMGAMSKNMVKEGCFKK